MNAETGQPATPLDPVAEDLAVHHRPTDLELNPLGRLVEKRREQLYGLDEAAFTG